MELSQIIVLPFYDAVFESKKIAKRERSKVRRIIKSLFQNINWEDAYNKLSGEIFHLSSKINEMKKMLR